MGIHISSQLEARLMENAAAMGISTDEYVERLLQEDQRRARERRRQAASRLQELSEQAVLGPDLTLRDLVEEGRR